MQNKGNESGCSIKYGYESAAALGIPSDANYSAVRVDRISGGFALSLGNYTWPETIDSGIHTYTHFRIDLGEEMLVPLVDEVKKFEVNSAMQEDLGSTPK